MKSTETSTTTSTSSPLTNESFPPPPSSPTPPNYTSEQQRVKRRRLGLGNLSMLPDSITGTILGRDVTTAQSQWKKQVEDQDRYAKWLETFGSIL